MLVKVKLMGIYQKLFGKNIILLQLNNQPTIKEVIQKIVDSSPKGFKQAFIDPELNSPKPNALIIVDGREISVLEELETKLKNGSEVVIIPVSHGG